MSRQTHDSVSKRETWLVHAIVRILMINIMQIQDDSTERHKIAYRGIMPVR
jgi:hypothetical protein